MSKQTDRDITGILDKTMEWSRQRSYAGHSKHDALNSRFLEACSMNNAFLRLLITQLVMRCPFNIRPFLGVPRLRNPKGVGLFAYALLDLAGISTDENSKEQHLSEAEELLKWLIGSSSPNAPASTVIRHAFELESESVDRLEDGASKLIGMGWGYHYPWQDQGFFQPRHYPNRVVTSWIGFAFLRAYEIGHDHRYLDACREIAEFLTENPRVLYEDEDKLCYSYVPLRDIDWAVMDVSALVSAFLARYAAALDRAGRDGGDFRELAGRLMSFVVDKQTDYGAWFYTWPAGDSHIKHDNYHTGIILDCLADYMSYARDQRWNQQYLKGLAYYRKALFSSRGAPRWMNDREFPRDIHGAAAGILAFTRAAAFDGENADAHLGMADQILEWTVGNLYDARGFFRYQKTRFYRKNFCLMRWGNAWMCRAIAQRLQFNGC